MKIKQLLEVSIIDKLHSSPIRDDQTLRMYHGFNRLEDALLACMYGLSGKTLAQRIYSYEGNNNPRGLFVTPDFESAKKFGSVIVELHIKASDLEAPVWPSGSYTVQGQMSKNFKDDNDREARRMSDREAASKSQYPEVADSDRPELADSLIVGGERQALFTGDLNANSIRAVWVAAHKFQEGDYRGAYKRMKPKEFVKHFQEYNPDAKNRASSYRVDADPRYKLFKPRDIFDPDALEEILNKKFKNIPLEKFLKVIADNPDHKERYFWPNQITDLEKYLKVQRY